MSTFFLNLTIFQLPTSLELTFNLNNLNLPFLRSKLSFKKCLDLRELNCSYPGLFPTFSCHSACPDASTTRSFGKTERATKLLKCSQTLTCFQILRRQPNEAMWSLPVGDSQEKPHMCVIFFTSRGKGGGPKCCLINDVCSSECPAPSDQQPASPTPSE